MGECRNARHRGRASRLAWASQQPSHQHAYTKGERHGRVGVGMHQVVTLLQHVARGLHAAFTKSVARFFDSPDDGGEVLARFAGPAAHVVRCRLEQVLGVARERPQIEHQLLTGAPCLGQTHVGKKRRHTSGALTFREGGGSQLGPTGASLRPRGASCSSEHGPRVRGASPQKPGRQWEPGRVCSN